MNKLNVCLLNDSFPPMIDGVANTVVNYANIIKGDDLGNPYVITPEYPNKDDSQFSYDVLRYKSIDTTKLVHGYRTGLPFSGTVLNDALQRQPDIIHTHCPVVSTMIARELRNKCDAPIVFTYHTKFDVDIAKAVGSKFLQKEAAKVLVNNISACDEVWVVSKGAGDNLKGLGYQGDVVIMDNGVDFPKGRADQDAAAKSVEGYDIPSDVPLFLFVGRLMWYKGIKIILDALAKLNEDQIDFRMLFVGKGCDSPEMEKYAAEHGLKDKCIFMGPVYDREKLRAINTRADLFLFPSTYDTNGLVVREAAACGLASVVIQGSCASEGITDGRNGFFCEENGQSMYELIKRNISDLSNVHQVGLHAMDEIYISWEDSVHHAYDRYQVIIDRKKSGLIPKKTTAFSDEFYSAAGSSLLALKKARLSLTDEFFQVKNKISFESIDEEFSHVRNQISEFLHHESKSTKHGTDSIDRYY